MHVYLTLSSRVILNGQLKFNRESWWLRSAAAALSNMNWLLEHHLVNRERDRAWNPFARSSLSCFRKSNTWPTLGRGGDEDHRHTLKGRTGMDRVIGSGLREAHCCRLACSRAFRNPSTTRSNLRIEPPVQTFAKALIECSHLSGNTCAGSSIRGRLLKWSLA